MDKQPLQRVHNGAFLVNETAKNDPACQLVMEQYLKQLEREEWRRNEIRAGRMSLAPEMTTWDISDRD